MEVLDKKSYLKPSTDCCTIGTKEDFADEIIISTSNATSVPGGGDLNAKEGMGLDWFEGEELLSGTDYSLYLNSVWDED
jgi:hypothetical protein